MTAHVRRATSFLGLTIEYDDTVLEPRSWTELQSTWAAELVADAPPGPCSSCAAGPDTSACSPRSAGRDHRLLAVDVDPTACRFIARPTHVPRRPGRAGRGARGPAGVGRSAAERALRARDRRPAVGRLRRAHGVPRGPARSPSTAAPDGLAVARACVEACTDTSTPVASLLLQLGDDSRPTPSPRTRAAPGGPSTVAADGAAGDAEQRRRGGPRSCTRDPVSAWSAAQQLVGAVAPRRRAPWRRTGTRRRPGRVLGGAGAVLVLHATSPRTQHRPPGQSTIVGTRSPTSPAHAAPHSLSNGGRGAGLEVQAGPGAEAARRRAASGSSCDEDGADVAHRELLVDGVGLDVLVVVADHRRREAEPLQALRQLARRQRAGGLHRRQVAERRAAQPPVEAEQATARCSAPAPQQGLVDVGAVVGVQARRRPGRARTARGGAGPGRRRRTRRTAPPSAPPWRRAGEARHHPGWWGRPP